MSRTRDQRRQVERAIAQNTAGFSQDKRRRRNQHRTAAQALLDGGTLFNSTAPVGSTPWTVAQWHLRMARCWKR